MRKRFRWLELFATDERKPVRALTEYGIEFRDSYILSGQGLEGTGRDLTKYHVEKLVGELDYTLIRHNKTILTPQEWHYIENDGLVLMAFIQEEIERNNNNIANIPMTKTGYVRKYMRNQCYHNGQAGHGERRKVKDTSFNAYRKIMQRLTLTLDEYLEARECFQGGFTHANQFNAGLIFNDVSSYDLTSAYPAAMVLERYPMGTGTFLKCPTFDEMRFYLKNYACVFRVALRGVLSRFRGDNFISVSKCRNLKNVEADNGRVMKADYLEITITDIDFDIFKAFYTFEVERFFDLWYYPRGYLPRQFIKGVLGLYADKTRLKGVEGMEAEYMLKKGLLNSTFGMSVTSIEQAMNKYENDEWVKEQPDMSELIEKYNNSKNRFLFYLWGVFTTAHVRRTIARAVLNLGDSYIYADTDSVKFIDLERHKAFFDSYNEMVLRKIRMSSEKNKLDLSLFMPKTKDGKEKPIGLFDYEGTYKRFRTLGAKRYFVEYYEPHSIGGIMSPYSLTISGVNKGVAIPSLVKKAEEEGRDIFDYFKIGEEYGEDTAGKQTHTYCDYETKGLIRDYRGVVAPYHELSSLHLEATTYKLTTTEEYFENLYLDHLQRIERREKIKK